MFFKFFKIHILARLFSCEILFNSTVKAKKKKSISMIINQPFLKMNILLGIQINIVKMNKKGSRD